MIKKIMIDVNAVIKTAGMLSDDESRGVLQMHCLEKDKTIATNGRTLMIHKAINDGVEKPIAVKLPVNLIKKHCTKTKKGKIDVIISSAQFEYDDEKEGMPGELSMPDLKVSCSWCFNYPPVWQVVPDPVNYKPFYFAINPQLLALFPGDVFLMSAIKEMSPIMVFPAYGTDWIGVIMPMVCCNDRESYRDKEVEAIKTYCDLKGIQSVELPDNFGKANTLVKEMKELRDAI
jgi:hypothetical protein